jgi:hypothetical protein
MVCAKPLNVGCACLLRDRAHSLHFLIKLYALSCRLCVLKEHGVLCPLGNERGCSQDDIEVLITGASTNLDSNDA